MTPDKNLRNLKIEKVQSKLSRLDVIIIANLIISKFKNNISYICIEF